MSDSRVSRDHLVIDGSGATWRLEDRASKNGTRIDGIPVSRATLDKSAWISIGGLPVLAEPVEPHRLEAERVARTRLEQAASEVQNALAPDRSREDIDAQAAGMALVPRCLEAVRRLTDCERAALWLIEPSGARKLAWMVGNRRPAPSRSVVEQVLETGTAVFCSDTAGAEALARRESVVAGGIRALIAVPLGEDRERQPAGRIFGVVYADSRQPGKLFSELDAQLLTGLAEQLRLTLASVRLRTAIEELREQPQPARDSRDSEFQRLLDRALTPYRAG